MQCYESCRMYYGSYDAMARWTALYSTTIWRAIQIILWDLPHGVNEQDKGGAGNEQAMLQRLLKRSQEAVVAFHFNSPQAGVLPNVNDAEPELVILGGRQSIITPRSASHSPAAQSANSSSAIPDPLQPNAASNFDITSDTVAAAPAIEHGSDFDMPIFLTNHVGCEHQQISDWPSFNVLSFEQEPNNEFSHTATYMPNPAVDQDYGLSEQGDLTATMVGNGAVWSMFANKLLP
ncbi:hypothetical protein FIBSPDRAFT_901503 [Athelia psychrophila]|uniref:Uncharacterized protein n=1 Tax=Athelia psychrophila TaxID=1759441 RepID=A0A165X2C7_9AGAM|nr:hypothetical protein FIBSPDRAFT_901503 [Fibularhizoctonia sp. CBS 109695]